MNDHTDIRDLRHRVTTVEAKMDNFGDRFDRHEKAVIDALQQGNKTMTDLQIGQAKVTTAFGSFCKWFKWTMATIISILLGLLGVVASFMGVLD